MSISTTENASSARALDKLHAEQDAWAREREHAEAEIRAGFALLGVVPAQGIALPMISFLGRSTRRETVQSLREYTMNGIAEDGAYAALLKVLAESECPLVQKLKTALADEYVKEWADDIADYRAGD